MGRQSKKIKHIRKLAQMNKEAAVRRREEKSGKEIEQRSPKLEFGNSDTLTEREEEREITNELPSNNESCSNLHPSKDKSIASKDESCIELDSSEDEEDIEATEFDLQVFEEAQKNAWKSLLSNNADAGIGKKRKYRVGEPKKSTVYRHKRQAKAMIESNGGNTMDRFLVKKQEETQTIVEEEEKKEEKGYDELFMIEEKLETLGKTLEPKQGQAAAINKMTSAECQRLAAIYTYMELRLEGWKIQKASLEAITRSFRGKEYSVTSYKVKRLREWTRFYLENGYLPLSKQGKHPKRGILPDNVLA